MSIVQKYMWVLLVFGWQLSVAQTLPGKGLRVYVFLSPECPLCKNYTRTLNILATQYAGRLSIYGIIPGKTWKPADLTAFNEKYHLAFSLQQDPDIKLARSLHATTTPEAILVAADNTIVYRGAIDNWYKTLGQPQSHPTQNYLQDAIDYTLRHETPPVRQTTPVGCLINDF
jgi:thiol-disulfide isomerase/thioredoxin